jgi:opacity protein-like surface antigen
MRRLFLAAILAAFCAPAALAQSDYNKSDVFVGFSHNRVDTGFDDDGDPDFDDIVDEREGFNGFTASVKGNVSRYAGVKFDYSFHRKEFDLAGGPTGTTDVDVNLHNFLGGVEFKDNAPETRVKPFAHLLAGVAHSRGEVSSGAVSFRDRETGFAAAVGGGVDFRLSPRVDFRAVQFDYNPNRLGGEMQHNFRVGIGFIFR